ncbi:class I SAM-dependent DNA methyltransferase [Butyrivibrio sp. WCD3002]|uniref:class I SAM-dependent DNA methyltransferase n=1 Tax=Butyrivibrio sp. WCD3002 TaxID=1280676 RepID=UPI00040B626B|nr:N-6 DNA methylase [Butyrivibrio sp. WCD3002]
MAKDNFNYEKSIWDIAEYTRDTINRKDFDKVILPFTLLRRLECALEDTKDAVVEEYKKQEKNENEEEYDFTSVSKKPFYNYSKYSLKTIPVNNTWLTLKAYIGCFSKNAREIMEKFKMADTCTTLEEAGMLYEVCQRFSKFNLSPDNVSDREMSDIYEHLIERYGEEIAEDAEDFMTPKDVVRLAVKMIFANDDELLNSDNGAIRTLYDPTLGTAGFICDALDLLDEWHSDKNMVAPAMIIPYGQECEAESWAIGKSNLLIRNISSNDGDDFNNTQDLSENIMWGDTLIDDQFSSMKFNYILSNPPYGKKWEKQKEKVEEEAQKGYDGRFGAGTPRINDGAMLFLQHVVSKMASTEQGGGKAAVVLAGSPLFNGDPGQGESNIRRWLFKIDVVDCIVKLPEALFFHISNLFIVKILNNEHYILAA